MSPFPWVTLWVLKYCTGAKGECLPPLLYLWVKEINLVGFCLFFYYHLIFFPLDSFSDIREWLGKILLEFHWNFSVFTLLGLCASVLDLLDTEERILTH